MVGDRRCVNCIECRKWYSRVLDGRREGSAVHRRRRRDQETRVRVDGLTFHLYALIQWCSQGWVRVGICGHLSATVGVGICRKCEEFWGLYGGRG